MSEVTATLKRYELQGDAIEVILEISYAGMSPRLITKKYRTGSQLAIQNSSREVVEEAKGIKALVDAAIALKAATDNVMYATSAPNPVVTATLTNVFVDYYVCEVHLQLGGFGTSLTKSLQVTSADGLSLKAITSWAQQECIRLADIISYAEKINALIGTDLVAWARKYLG